MRLQPLTALCWFFDFEAVCRYRQHLDACAGAISLDDLAKRWEEAREALGLIDQHGVYKGKRRYRSMFIPSVVEK